MQTDLQIIINAFEKGIFTTIKGDCLPKSSKLIKVYATTVAGARRIVFLVDMITNDAFLLFYRSKSDKIGKNITIHNQDFKRTLNLYLTLLENDLETGSFDTHMQ